MTRPAVTIYTRTPRDRHTPTIRLIPFRSFPGMPIPGMPVALHTPGVTRPVPGFVHSFDADTGIVRVSPDFQTIRGLTTNRAGPLDVPHPHASDEPAPRNPALTVERVKRT